MAISPLVWSRIFPFPPGPKPTPYKDVCLSPTSPFTITPVTRIRSPWLPIIQNTLNHPDNHLPRFQRALAEYSSHFGATPTGYFWNGAQRFWIDWWDSFCESGWVDLWKIGFGSWVVYMLSYFKLLIIYCALFHIGVKIIVAQRMQCAMIQDSCGVVLQYLQTTSVYGRPCGLH